MADAQTPGENKAPRDKRLYGIWYGMIARCEHDGARTYACYGARGIAICPEWHDYDTFRSWAEANGYAPGLTIDRRDNSKGYSPDNCRWATPAEQARNRTNNRYITYDGATLTHSEWAAVIGVTPQAIYAAIKRGIDGAEYIRRHIDEGHGRKVCCSAMVATITVGEETHSIRRWGEIIGVSQTAIYHAIWRGKDPAEYIQSHLDAGYARRVYGSISHPIAADNSSDAARCGRREKEDEMTNLMYITRPAEPPADLDARCPVCHQLCDTLLYDATGDIVGCDACTHDQDITDYATSVGEDYQSARCPVCGALADTITLDAGGEVLGCNECLTERDAYDYAIEEHNSYMEWLREMAQGGDHYGD